MEEIFRSIKRILREKGIDFEVKRHEAVYTSEEAARVRGVPQRMGVKALVAKSEKGFLIILVRADKRADLKRIAELEGVKGIQLASREEVLRVTKCEVGSVPPFGFGEVRTYLDRDVLKEEKVTFNAGLHEASVVMRGKDLERVMKGVLY